jgi:hypothetical protein
LWLKKSRISQTLSPKFKISAIQKINHEKFKIPTMPETVPDSCFQREIPYEMLDLANHPTPADLEKNMGKELTEMFLKTCSPFERVLFGRDKPLKGPPSDLWISPEEYGNSCSIKKTPIKSIDCLQALTHQGILEIGEKLEEKIEEARMLENEKIIKETQEFMEFECNLRVKFHVENEKKRQEEFWTNEVTQMKTQHEKELAEVTQLYEEAMAILKEFTEKKNQLENKKKLGKVAEGDTPKDSVDGKVWCLLKILSGIPSIANFRIQEKVEKLH